MKNKTIIERQNKMKNNKIPKQVDDAFENMNDLLSKLSDRGYDSYFKDKDDLMNKTQITHLGILVKVKDKQNKPYEIIVTPSHLTDADEFRKKIVFMAEGIKKNFPNLFNQQSIQ